MVKINFFTVSQNSFSRKALSLLLCCLFTATAYSQSIQLTILDLFHCEQNDTICGVFVDITPTIQNECSEYDLDWAIDFDSDNNVDSIGLGSLVGVLPYGNHRVVWAAEDTCDMDWAVQTLELSDCTVPMKACSDNVVLLYLDESCILDLQASSLDPGDLDNCEYNFSFSEDTEDITRTYGQSDVGEQEVELWAVDDSENIDSCVQELMLLDTGQLCLPGVSIVNCNAILVCTGGESDCGSFVSYVPEFIDLCAGLDVIYIIDLNQTGDDDLQGVDSLFRLVEYGVHLVTFIATDSCGADTCEFILQILDCTLPVAACPSDTFQFELDSNCILQLNANSFSQYFTDNCENVRMSFSNNVNDTVRSYGFMDLGILELELWGTDDYFNQESCDISINIFNGGNCETVAFTSCDTIIVCNDQDSLCATYIESFPGFSQGCSSLTLFYEIDFDRDGMIDSIGTGPIAGNWPYGEHLITWIVSDDCVSDTCEQVVILYDCAVPEIVCISGLIIVELDEDDNATVIAESLISESMDNCELEFAFDSLFIQTDTLFTCDQVGDQDLIIYAQDGSGNIATCDVFLDIQSGGDTDCKLPEVKGTVRRPIDRRIENVIMKLEFPQFILRYDTTDGAGEYLFTFDNALSVNYELSASKKDVPMDGVSTFDIVKIQKHLLGIEEFKTFFHYVAADVNGSCSVSALDMVDIRKLLLGLEQEFPTQKEWVIWESSYDTSAIDALCAIPNLIEFTLDSIHTYDWWAVKVGDVSDVVSFKGDEENEDRSSYSVSYYEKEVNNQTVFSFYTDQIISAEGIQMSLDVSQLDIDNVTSEHEDFYYSIVDNELRIICYDVSSLSQNMELFSIVTNSNDNVELELSTALKAEAYASEYALPIVLESRQDENSSKESWVHIYPNPVNGAQKLTIRSNRTIQSIDLYNSLGTHLGTFAQTLELDLSLINAEPGVIFARITDESGIESIQKLVVQ